jgi:non-specific serine/threonine protein kinase
LRARVGVYPQIWDTAAYERVVVIVRSVLGDRAVAALEAGKALPLEDAVRLGLEAFPATARSPRDTRPLTTRERQVAALVAHGLSNRQIAARLVISTRTASNHVEHIFNKLGLRTRSQIAVWAVNAGLLLRA